MKKNIDKRFLNFLKKYFPKKNKLHKIFKKSNIKISYNYMSNVSSIIEEHNKSLLQPKITKYGCNCRVKNICPLQDQCQTSNLIYRADVENEVNDGKKIYFGLAATTFKERFNSSEILKKVLTTSRNTELSKHELSLKDVKIPCTIKSLIVEKVYLKTKIYICPSRLEEKLHLIEYFDHICLLHKTSEFIDHCRHQNKLLLNCFKKNNNMD